MRLLSEWPRECLLLLADHIPSLRDLNALSRTARLFHHLFNLRLYRRGIESRGAQSILSWAINHANVATARLLVVAAGGDLRSSVNLKYYNEGTALQQAVHARAQRLGLNFVGRKMRSDPKRWAKYQKTLSGTIPLEDFDAMIVFLLEQGLDVNRVDRFGWTPLLQAIRYGDYDVVPLLVEQGRAELKKAGPRGTPLSIAVAYGADEAVIDLFLRKGVNIDAKSGNGLTPLHEAIELCSKKAVQMLLERGADVNVADNEGLTPLHYAVRSDRGSSTVMVAIAEMLISKGANIEAVDRSGWTPLHTVAAKGRWESLFRLLVQNGANINARDAGGQTAEELARSNKRAFMVTCLCRRSARLTAKHGAYYR